MWDDKCNASSHQGWIINAELKVFKLQLFFVVVVLVYSFREYCWDGSIWSDIDWLKFPQKKGKDYFTRKTN